MCYSKTNIAVRLIESKQISLTGFMSGIESSCDPLPVSGRCIRR